MEKRNRNIWDILAWVAFAIVVLYFFLKIVGVTKGPITVDIVALLSGAYFVGTYVQKRDLLSQDVECIKTDLRFLDRKCPVFQTDGTKTR